MYWLLFLLFGAICGYLGYFYGRRWSLRQENHSHLTLENNQLKHEIDSLKSKDNDTDSSETDTSYADDEVSEASSVSAPAISDEDVVAHPLYLSLSERHSALKAKLGEAQSSASETSETDGQTEVYVSEQSVKQHAAYRQLHEQYLELQTSNANVADDDYQAQQSAVIEELQQENERLNLALENCEENVAALRHKAEKNHLSANHEIAKEQAGANFDADAAKATFGKRIKQDDLTLVLGIGPKISELLIADGIDTWAKLGEASTEQCQHVLNNAGERFKLHDPSTWPRQAKLAADGDWQALFDWQDKLDKGREVE